MKETGRPIDKETRQRAVSGLRRAMWKLAAVAVLVSFVGIAGQQLSAAVYAAFFAVLTGMALSVLMAACFVLFFVGTYAEDHDAASRRLRDSWGYVSRATTFGLAAAGIGALLATVLPVRLSGAVSSSTEALPAAGWIAIAFGSVGTALGILEEWRERQRDDTDGP